MKYYYWRLSDDSCCFRVFLKIAIFAADALNANMNNSMENCFSFHFFLGSLFARKFSEWVLFHFWPMRKRQQMNGRNKMKNGIAVDGQRNVFKSIMAVYFIYIRFYSMVIRLCVYHRFHCGFTHIRDRCRGLHRFWTHINLQYIGIM